MRKENLGAPQLRVTDKRVAVRVKYIILSASFSQIYISDLIYIITLEP